ncbi:MAG: hypothetical protein LBD67_03010 [Candidatus Accumulibacter sp.]|nr:hypothetical protein [Accumulibacter sp.]
MIQSATNRRTSGTTDSNGTLTKVEYFRGTTLIGTATAAPYSYSWTDVPAENYTLTDSDGTLSSTEAQRLVRTGL